MRSNIVTIGHASIAIVGLAVAQTERSTRQAKEILEEKSVDTSQTGSRSKVVAVAIVAKSGLGESQDK